MRQTGAEPANATFAEPEISDVSLLETDNEKSSTLAASDTERVALAQATFIKDANAVPEIVRTQLPEEVNFPLAIRLTAPERCR